MNIQLAAAERLEQAVAVIREHGWTQRALRNNSGNVCIDGALFSAQIGRVIGCDDRFCRPSGRGAGRICPDDVSLFTAGQILDMLHVLTPNVDLCFITLAQWNDKKQRTKDEVIAVMVGAAALLRAKGTPNVVTPQLCEETA